MKVVCIDNYDRDNVSDTLIKENLSDEEAKATALELNTKFGGPHSSNYYVVKPDDYQLYRWEP